MLSIMTCPSHLLYVHTRIENFVYSMVKFGLISCTLMVCVSDPKCMELCDAALFPCYDFQYHHQHREVTHCYSLDRGTD